ncbi:ABC-type dipeptide transport system, periplasmic component [Leptolyngbyaceae cyanobacterium JSC-12]|nr:ABC-type dipeptide transport system, periplasmic component [Leptolyngbyaceae cyanobacterium JSC-12]
MRFHGLRRSHLFFVSFFAVVAIALTNCATNQTQTPTAGSTASSPAPAGALVFGLGGQPVNLEPGNITDGNSIYVQQQIYNRLMEFKPGTPDLEPALATEWSSSPDGKTWTFKLRQGVKFHDGTDFNAEAVKFNVERWWDKNHPNGDRNAGKNYEIWQQIFGGFKDEPASVLQSVRIVDPYTIQFGLKQPFAAFPNAIASGFFGIASPTAIKKAGASYGTPGSLAVGTGAYVFKEWRTGDRVVLEKNPNYWETGLPKTNQLVIRFIQDPAARLAQVRAGQVDFTVDLAPDQKKELDSDANLQAVARPSFNVGYLALNPAYKPLADVRVRQAIAYAINRPEIVKAFWGELGQHNPHFLPDAISWANSTNLQPYPFDPQKARQLLAEAGYGNGFDLELMYMPVSRPYFPTPKPIAEAFAADLSAIGIRVKLNTKDWAAYLADRRKPPGYQAFMLGWTGDYGDPDSFYYPHYGPGSTDDIGNWKNERVFQLLNQGRATQDQASRAKLYAEIDEILYQEVLRLPIVHSQPLLAQRKTITGWQTSPLGSEPFKVISKQ